MRHLFAAALALLSVSSARADDAADAQAVIRSQIEAFRAGDNALAYSYADPDIREIFPTLDRFMAMVTGAYKPVWKPGDYAFGESAAEGPDRIAQKVQVVGPDGKGYEAMYILERQPDGSWKIAGVSLRGLPTVGT